MPMWRAQLPQDFDRQGLAAAGITEALFRIFLTVSGPQNYGGQSVTYRIVFLLSAVFVFMLCLRCTSIIAELFARSSDFGYEKSLSEFGYRGSRSGRDS